MLLEKTAYASTALLIRCKCSGENEYKRHISYNLIMMTMQWSDAFQMVWRGGSKQDDLSVFKQKELAASNKVCKDNI